MDYIPFIQEHSHYIFLIIFVLWLAKGPVMAVVHGVKYLSVTDAYQHFKDRKSKAVFLDVRTDWEKKKGPRLKGTLNIPYNDLDIRKDELAKKGMDQLIIIVCYSAKGRARNSAIKLKKLGFTNAQIMKGGLAAWKVAKYPLT